MQNVASASHQCFQETNSRCNSFARHLTGEFTQLKLRSSYFSGATIHSVLFRFLWFTEINSTVTYSESIRTLLSLGRAALLYKVVHPPSINRVVPVISDAAGEARNNTAFATSFGSPILPKTILESTCFF